MYITAFRDMCKFNSVDEHKKRDIFDLRCPDNTAMMDVS